MPKRSEYVSAVQAAQLTGLSEKTIRRKLETGELKAEKVSGVYQISVRELDKLAGGKSRTMDLILERLRQLEDTQDRQAEQIIALERRIEELTAPPVPSGQLPSIQDQLPLGSMLLVRFAEQHGLAARTITDHAKRGLINVTVIDKGGRPQYWLTPDQQEELRQQRNL